MYELPTSVTIENKEYKIRNGGDYRMVLDCFSALQDIELSEQERIIASLCIFYDDVLSLDCIDNVFDTEEKLIEATNKMAWFFNCGDSDYGRTSNIKLIDWEQDSQMITSAVNKVAGYEIRSVEYMHWWTFLGYYSAVGNSTLSTVVEIRSKLKKGKKLEKYEQEFKRENPHYFIWNSKSVEDIEAEEYIKSIWNKE